MEAAWIIIKLGGGAFIVLWGLLHSVGTIGSLKETPTFWNIANIILAMFMLGVGLYVLLATAASLV